MCLGQASSGVSSHQCLASGSGPASYYAVRQAVQTSVVGSSAAVAFAVAVTATVAVTAGVARGSYERTAAPSTFAQDR